MLVYRIVHKDYSQSLSASGKAGRWNGNGKKVIYCAESIALAFLENMIRRQGVGFNNDFKIMIIEIPASIIVDKININDLEQGWRDFKDYSKCQPMGNKWLNEGKTAVLKVPSSVLPEAFNFILNTAHPDYSKITLRQTTNLIPDERIEAILKNKK